MTRRLAGPGPFRGLIHLSPITEDVLFGTPEFQSHQDALRMLYLHGGRDLRIPRRTGYDAERKCYEGEDHYLILSQREAVLEGLARFTAQGTANPRGVD